MRTTTEKGVATTGAVGAAARTMTEPSVATATMGAVEAVARRATRAHRLATFTIGKAPAAQTTDRSSTVELVFSDCTPTRQVRSDEPVIAAIQAATGTLPAMVERPGGVVSALQTFADHGYAAGSVCVVTRRSGECLLGGMETFEPGTRVAQARVTPEADSTALSLSPDGDVELGSELAARCASFTAVTMCSRQKAACARARAVRRCRV